MTDQYIPGNEAYRMMLIAIPDAVDLSIPLNQRGIVDLFHVFCVACHNCSLPYQFKDDFHPESFIDFLLPTLYALPSK